MSVVDEIAALFDRTDLSALQKSRLVAAIRAGAVRDVLAPSLPRTFIAGPYSVTVTRVLITAGTVRVWCDATKTGVPVALDLPLVLVNPPLLVVDPAGSIRRVGRNDGRLPPPPDRVYRLAPLQAIGEVLVRHVQSVAR